jgi:hypothetical protein
MRSPARPGRSAPAAAPATSSRRPSVSRAARPAPARPASQPRGQAAPAAAAQGAPSSRGVLSRAISRLRGDDVPHASATGAPTPEPESFGEAEERPVMQLHDAPAPAAISRTPAVRGTSAQSLARAIGAEVSYADDGTPGIEFPDPSGSPAGATPYVPFSTSPRTVSRVDSAAPASNGSQATTADHAPPPALTQNHQASPGGAAGIDPDQLYEDFLARLRRDVLHEREQHGMLVDELP